jgi:hypothetical protein
MNYRTVAAIALVAGLLAPSMTMAAAITYVDATLANTTLASGGTFSPTTTPSGGVNNDDNWSIRPFGHGGGVFTSNDSGAGETAEDAPGLATTISGLTPGAQYQIFAYFWDGNGNWRLKASVTTAPPLGDDLSVSFSANGSATSTAAPTAVLADFAVPPQAVFEAPDRNLHQASLGITTADANGQIVIFIDDLANPTVSTTQRTWYDGVGYALVPEPAAFGTAAMTLAALLGVARRRQR